MSINVKKNLEIGSKKNLEIGSKKNLEIGSKKNLEIGSKKKNDIISKKNLEIGSKKKTDIISKKKKDTHSTFTTVSASPSYNGQLTKEQKIQSSFPAGVTLADHIKWFRNEISKNTPTADGLGPTDYTEGSVKRVIKLSKLCSILRLNMSHGSIVVFKVLDNYLRKEVNYGMIMCENIKDVPQKTINGLNQNAIVGNVVIQYYSTSGNFVSCDGEYRPNLALYIMLLSITREHHELWNEIDHYVTNIRKARQWYLSSSYFHNRENANENYDIERAIIHNSIHYSIFNVAWLNTIYDLLYCTTETHLNETYKEIFLHHKEEDCKFLQNLITNYGETLISNLVKETRNIYAPSLYSNNHVYVPIGYKMIPLNIREIQDPFKLKYKSWREYIISLKCNDLVTCKVASGFPVVLDWFLIKNTNRGLFDNKSQFNRMKHSELAKDILHSLYEAQRSTYFATSDLSKLSDKNIKKWISNKFKRLSDKISDPINYSIEEIIMSNVTLTFMSEFVGRTTADTFNLLNDKKYDELLGHPITDYHVFAKYIFDICYNLLVLNKRMNCLHGDFHLNNSTIGFCYDVEKNHRVSYLLNDTQYVFPNTGYFAYVIDFSRSIINPESYADLTTASIPNTFKLIDNYDKFALNETNNLLYLYLNLFPNKKNQKEELLVIFKNNFNAVFKLLTCIDLYMYSVRMGIVMEQQKYKFHARSIELINKINKLTEVYLTTDINLLIKDAAYAKIILENDWPINVIIGKCFTEFVNGATFKKPGVITDSFDLNNEIKYSISKYELFPPYLKEAKADVAGVIQNVEFITNVRKQRRINDEKNIAHMFEHLRFLSAKVELNLPYE